MLFTDLIGHVGVASFLIAYYLLQKGRLTYSSLEYLGMNLAGAILVMISLLYNWNGPAFVLEAAWAIISIYGIYRSLLAKKHGNG